MDVFVASGQAYVAVEDCGLLIVDVDDPTAPRIVGGVDTPYDANGVTASAEFVYIADRLSGLQILPIQCVPTMVSDETTSAPYMSFGCYPNPFNPHTRIRFILARGECTDLSVFDAIGRRVRSLLADYPLDSGSYELTWDGRDDQGRELPSGLYFCRLETGNRKESIKLVLLR